MSPEQGDAELSKQLLQTNTSLDPGSDAEANICSRLTENLQEPQGASMHRQRAWKLETPSSADATLAG